MGVLSLLSAPLFVWWCAALTAQALRLSSPLLPQFPLHHRRSSSTSTIVPSSPSPNHQRTVCSTIASVMAIVSLNTMMIVSSHPLAALAVRVANRLRYLPSNQHSSSSLIWFSLPLTVNFLSDSLTNSLLTSNSQTNHFCTTDTLDNTITLIHALIQVSGAVPKQ